MYCVMLYRHDEEGGHYVSGFMPVCFECGSDDSVSACHGCGDFFCSGCIFQDGHLRDRCVHRTELLEAVRAIALSVDGDSAALPHLRDSARMVMRWVALREGFKVDAVDSDTLDLGR